MKRYILAITLSIAGLALMSAKESGATLHKVSVTVPEMYTQNGNLNVNFDLDLSQLDPGKNQQIVYTPVLISDDGTQSKELEKIVINGRTAAIVSQRHGAKKIENVGLNLTTKNLGNASYSSAVAYEPWMENCRLYLSEDLCGCGDVYSYEKTEMASFNNEPVLVTNFLSMFVEPKIERPKIRHEKGSAFVDFVVNKYAIDPAYRDNARELGKITHTIDLVKDDKNVNITNIDIHGFASPEGPYDFNETLAKNRTQALTKYVMGLYTIPNNLFSQQSTPEDWAGLRKLVAESDINYKRELLAIIDSNTLSPDEKDNKIKYDYPNEYDFMLKNWYPGLRRSDYTISYEVRPFTPEEALVIMKEKPHQVSLHEMFWAAQSLGVNSDGYNEIAELAVATYPDEPVANYNAAIVAINKGEFAKAQQYLAKVPESGETLNLLGVIELNSENYQKAEDYFNKSLNAGYAPAANGKKLIDDLKRYKMQNR